MKKHEKIEYEPYGQGWDEFLGTQKIVFPDLKKADKRGLLYEYKIMCGVSPGEYGNAKDQINKLKEQFLSSYSHETLRRSVLEDLFTESKDLKKAFEDVYKYEEYQLKIGIYSRQKALETELQRTDRNDPHALNARFIDAKGIKDSFEQYQRMRVGSIRDVIDKELFRTDLSYFIGTSSVISPNARFHGCAVYNAEQIIASHGISSAADRNSYGMEVSDKAGEFSVTRPNEIGLTLGDDHTETSYTHLKNNISTPGGCVFVLMSSPEIESVMEQAGVASMSFSNITKMRNVNFDMQPDVLQGIITTEENKKHIQNLCDQNGLNIQVFSATEYANGCLELERSQGFTRTAFNEAEQMYQEQIGRDIGFLANTIERKTNEFYVDNGRIMWDISRGDPTGSIKPFPVAVANLNEQGQMVSCVSRESFQNWAKSINLSQLVNGREFDERSRE